MFKEQEDKIIQVNYPSFTKSLMQVDDLQR